MKLLLGDVRDTVDRLAFGPGERLLVAASGGGRVDLWDAATGLRADAWSSPRNITDLAWLPDGRVLVAVAGHPVEVIDPAAGKSVTFPDGGANVYRLAADPNQPVVYTAHVARERTTLARWDADPDSDTFRRTWSVPVDGLGLAVAVSPDGGRVTISEMSPGSGRTGWAALCVHSEATGELVRRITLGSAREGAARLAFDARARLTAGGRGAVTLFDAGTGGRLGKLPAEGVLAVAAHPDGRRLLTGGEDGFVRVWDAGTRSEVAAFGWEIGKVAAVAVRRDGCLAAAGGEDGRVMVWDFEL